MTKYQNRQNEIVTRIAAEAIELPRLASGLWFHNDIRNNYYYASYLLAAATDEQMPIAFDRGRAVALGTEVLLRVLRLQNRDAEHQLFGHWPLGLNPSPEEAKPNPLPAEILGCLIAYFYDQYADQLGAELRGELEVTLETLYQAAYYRVPQAHYNHHESKYIATKLIFGSRYDDADLLQDGLDSLKQTLSRIQEKGMPEYGALPWFWHWVQAFTCAYACVQDAGIRGLLSDLLDKLWMVRAEHYLGGAWVGARMRSLAHDLPRDQNVLFDYVQFGDFAMPSMLPRVEYAGLLFYEAPAEARRIALERTEPTELSQVVVPWQPDAAPLHKYTYITKHYAIGGMLERVQEFDNEQHRWDIAFPLIAEDTINHLYMFQPGAGYRAGDPRHQHNNGVVQVGKHVVAARYASSAEGEQRLVGVLPKGEWVEGEKALFGYTFGVYVAIFLQGEYVLTEQEDRYELVSEGLPNGVIVEVREAAELSEHQVTDLPAFCRLMSKLTPVWSEREGKPSVVYRDLSGETYQLVSADSQVLPD